MKDLKALIDYTKVLERIGRADLEVAGIEFGKREHSFPVPEGFGELGRHECDPIAIEENTGEVVLLDHEVTGRIMAYVANNLASFLDALCVIEEHFEKCEENESLYENESLMKSSAQLAGTRAGGKKYEDFYFGVFGL